jgi:hypothetical protein
MRMFYKKKKKKKKKKGDHTTVHVDIAAIASSSSSGAFAAGLVPSGTKQWFPDVSFKYKHIKAYIFTLKHYRLHILLSLI